MRVLVREQRVHGDGPSDDIESDLHIGLLPDVGRQLSPVQTSLQ